MHVLDQLSVHRFHHLRIIISIVCFMKGEGGRGIPPRGVHFICWDTFLCTVGVVFLSSIVIYN
jgi:hypothetical protein